MLGWLIASHVVCRAAGPPSGSSVCSTAVDLWLRSLVLQGSGAGLDQGAFDVASDVRWEDWAGVKRTGGRLLPGIEHLIQLPSRVAVHQGVDIHKGLVHVATQKQRVGTAHVLGDGIRYIQGGELLLRGCLHGRSESDTTVGEGAKKT